MAPFGLPASLQSQVCATMNTLFVVPVNRLAASEGVLGLQQVALGGAGRFHAGGYGQVAEACAELVAERHGAFRPSERVQRGIAWMPFGGLKDARGNAWHVNSLTKEEPTDWGGGSGYYDAFVDVARA